MALPPFTPGEKMKKSVLPIATLAVIAALVAANPANAVTKKKTTKKKVTPTTAAPTTAAPTTVAPTTIAAPAGPVKASGDPVRIGLIAAESGRAAAAYKTAGKVADAWAKWVNEEKGGIGGRPVEIVFGDDKSDAATAQALAKDLIESKGIVGLVLQDSTAEAAIQSYIDEKKFPVIGGSGNNSAAGIGHGKSLYYFMTATGGSGASTANVAVAKKLGQAPFSAAVCSEVAACEAGAKLLEGEATKLGVKYGGVLKISASAPNYTAECLEIISRTAEVGRDAGYVQIGTDPTTLGRFVKDCSRQRYSGYYGASANSLTEGALDGLDDLRMGGYINGFPWWSEAAPVKQFRTAMGTYAKGLDFRDPTSTSTWATLELFRKVNPKAPANKDDVLKAYWAVKGETLDGLLPKAVTYTEGKPSPILNCMWTVNYTKGKFNTLVLDGDSGNGQTGDLRTWCN
jgi:branched-chain amino acid transport system substrate-binding protein